MVRGKLVMAPFYSHHKTDSQKHVYSAMRKHHWGTRYPSVHILLRSTLFYIELDFCSEAQLDVEVWW